MEKKHCIMCKKKEAVETFRTSLKVIDVCIDCHNWLEKYFVPIGNHLWL